MTRRDLNSAPPFSCVALWGELMVVAVVLCPFLVTGP